jgi:SCO1/SenC
MNWLGRCWFFVLAVAVASSSGANTIPALQAAPIPDVQVLDEASQPASLRSLLGQSGLGQSRLGQSRLNPSRGGPVILLPIFTRCTASCPVLTRKLEAALSSMNPAVPYRVVVFSFDPLETSESLRLYRMHQNVPADWRMVRSNEIEIRRFFGFFRYSVMNQEGKLVHPNEVFLLDQDLNWRWTLMGDNWTEREVTSAIDMTRAPGFGGWMKANPERLAWIGFVALILSVSVAMGWMARRKEVRQPRDQREMQITERAEENSVPGLMGSGLAAPESAHSDHIRNSNSEATANRGSATT